MISKHSGKVYVQLVLRASADNIHGFLTATAENLFAFADSVCEGGFSRKLSVDPDRAIAIRRKPQQ